MDVVSSTVSVSQSDIVNLRTDLGLNVARLARPVVLSPPAAASEGQKPLHKALFKDVFTGFKKPFRPAGPPGKPGGPSLDRQKSSEKEMNPISS